jgi:hypothetical protein
MRAPDGERRYGDEQWAKIKRALAEMGVDADAVVVTSTFGDKNGLRAELERLAAAIIALRDTPRSTPKKLAVSLREILTAIQSAQRAVDPLSSTGLALRPVAKAAKILKPEIGFIEAAGSRPRDNRRASPQTPFLKHLLRLWKEIAGPARRRVDAVKFLHACAVPVFPKLTEAVIGRWFDRQHRDNQRS